MAGACEYSPSGSTHLYRVILFTSDHSLCRFIYRLFSSASLFIIIPRGSVLFVSSSTTPTIINILLISTFLIQYKSLFSSVSVFPLKMGSY